MATATLGKELFKALPHLRMVGAKNLWFDFDDEAEVLYISLERPQNATDTDMLEDGVLLRTRGKKVVGITITNFSRKFR